MLELFAIFTKGGIVLWCFNRMQEAGTSATSALQSIANDFVKNYLLQERTLRTFEHSNLNVKHKLDNEFELVFIVAYQKILQLSYVDKFLDDIQLEFRDKFEKKLRLKEYIGSFEFQRYFDAVLGEAEQWAEKQRKEPKHMRSYEETAKKAKVSSLAITKESSKPQPEIVVPAKSEILSKEPANRMTVENGSASDDDNDEDSIISQNREALRKKMAGGGKKITAEVVKAKSPKAVSNKKTKKATVWDVGFGGGAVKASEKAVLDYSKDKAGDDKGTRKAMDEKMIGSMAGGLKGLEVDENFEFEEEEEIVLKSKAEPKKASMFSLFKGLVGNKTITTEMLKPVLEKLMEHMQTKNVATDIASKLCDSVSAKLEGKNLGTFEGLSSVVKATLTDSLVHILSPKRRVDIMRDIIESQRQSRPYVITFCGVNGVGKSTNLAKICFWLIENNFRVLIAACDTFRAGAVEQLRTHTRHLNSLHPPEKHNGQQMVQLYERGYGKDAAGIAMEAIHFANDTKIDVVLVDTAGRMQDNEPLMRALTKLIKVNEPDLVLFVGEALVGNEAVDQVTKFNQALADHSDSTNPHLIDGIVLTKFDTIDDKVGAAISLSYITGQPIMFIGTGQTYQDLRGLDSKAVIATLMK